MTQNCIQFIRDGCRKSLIWDECEWCGRMMEDIEDAVQRFEAVHLSRGPDGAGFGEIAQIKNENYHLKLALDEKNLQLERLKKLISRGVFVEDMEKMQSELPFVAESQAARSDSNSCGTDLEVVTHFSGSPYKGRRTNSKATENSVATTSMSHIRAEHEMFKHSVLPFMGKMISSLKLSTIFKKEGTDLEMEFNSFESSFSGSCVDCDSLRRILDDLLYYYRQMASILNRELKFKELSERLEYLFAIFLDPREYNMDPQEHIEYLREEITDTMIRIFHYQSMPPEKESLDYNDDRPISNYARTRSKNSFGARVPFANLTQPAQRIKSIEQGFEICAHAMNQAFGDKQELRAQEDSIPSVISTNEIPQEKAVREKDRLKESRSSLEFIPIGYDENVLNSKTPQRKSCKSREVDEVTPRANDENDPLQMFFQEQANYYDNTTDRRRK